MNAQGLATALDAAGYPCRVEGRAGMALLSVPSMRIASFGGADARAFVLSIAREHGFSHVALELADDAPTDVSAALPRD